MTETLITQSIEIFFSYSRKDKELRDKLANHLSSLKHEGVIKDWHDDEIGAGKELDAEIQKHLNTANVILLLISSDFIASEEHWKRDVKQAMERHNNGEARVIPVMLRPCDWEGTPFSRLQSLPKKGKPITSWQNQDEAFAEVAQDIRKTVEELIYGQKKLKNLTSVQKLKIFWKYWIPWRKLFTMLPTTTGVTTLVIFMRLFGLLQASELWFYDQMMRLQPIEAQDERLLVIEVTKKDIDEQPEKSRQASLSDETLLKVLNKLLENQQEKPRVIGLDIYRDFTAKNQELSELLKNNSMIFGVCNVGESNPNNPDAPYGVKPPNEIPLERLGFSDFLSDSEGIVRRQVLSMDISIGFEKSLCWSKRKPVSNSFSLELARHYLTYENKSSQEPFKNGNSHWRLGDVVFESVYGPNRGAYSVWKDLNGYQVLLNYRHSCSEKDRNRCSPEFVAKRVSVADILNTDFLQKYSLKDKIVLIGVSDYSYEAPWYTPFSSGGNQPIPGVVMQAQMVSQILSTVLDNRPLIKVWSIWSDMLWIFSWSVVGATIAYWCNSKRSLIISVGVVCIGLYATCLIFFISPTKCWIPFVPAALTLFGTGVIVMFIRLKYQKSLLEILLTYESNNYV